MFGVGVIRGHIRGDRRIARVKAAVYAGAWVDCAEGAAFWRFGVPSNDEADGETYRLYPADGIPSPEMASL